MKFVVSNRRAGKFRESEKQESREAVATAAGMGLTGTKLLNDFTPDDPLARRTLVMEGSEADMIAMDAQTTDDVIVEPLIEHNIDKTPLGAFFSTRVIKADSGFPTGTGTTVPIQVRGDGAPLAHATVYLIARPLFGEAIVLEEETPANGEVTFSLSPLYQPVFCVVVPYADFWSVRSPVQQTGTTTVTCRKISTNQRIDWWHRQTGFDSFDSCAGRDIRVGVIDTGFGPHPHLQGTDVGAFIGNQFDPAGGADVDVHGSHVAGSISGDPGKILKRAGVAPGVDLYSARVFPPDAGASNVDIANAIDFLSREKECDLINMSLGAPVPSQIIQDAMQDALERGTLCICAAANSFGPVEWPAAFPEAVAIAACGKVGEAPPESVSGAKEPNDPDLFGIDQLFFANFSCFGPEIDGIAPGVGIIATVPARHGLTDPYAALDGTSMASPVACGTLARALSKHPHYGAMPRDIHRADMARAVFRDLCDPIGLPPDFEGDGLPNE